MAEPNNPYAAPTAAVEDVSAIDGEFIPGGRSVPSGNAWQWIVDGFRLFQRNPGIWIAILIVFAIIAIVLSKLGGVGSLALTLIMPVFTGGLMLGCDALMRGEPLQIAHLFAGFRGKAGSLILVGVLTLAGWLVIVLIVGVVAGFSMFSAIMTGSLSSSNALATGAVAFLVSILLALGLSVPLGMAIWFAAPLVVFHELSPLDALKESFMGSLRNIVPFLIYGILAFVISILAAIPFGLGWLIWGPTLIASVYASYRDIYIRPAA